MPTTGLLLAFAALVTAVAYGPRVRADGLWAALLVITPVALFFVEPVARRISGHRSWEPAGFADLVVAAVGLAVAGVGVTLVLRVMARRSSA